MAHGQVTKVRSGAEKESDPNMFKCCLLPLLCSLSNLLTLQPSILRSALSSVKAGKCFGVIQPLSWRAALPVCRFYNTAWGIIKVSTIQIITATRQLKSVKAEINFFYKLFPQYTMTLKISVIVFRSKRCAESNCFFIDWFSSFGSFVANLPGF